MGANRNCGGRAQAPASSLADGGMGANRNKMMPLERPNESLADGGMGANRNWPAALATSAIA